MPKDNTKSLFGLYARDLQHLLEYGSWDKFKRVIQKAMAACEQSGQTVDHHFVQVGKKVSLVSGAVRGKLMISNTL